MPDNSPYSNPGQFGPGNTDIYSGQGMGLYDLFNTYQHITTMFGDTVEGSQAGIEAYDTYSEDLLRQQYREDYRGMLGSISQSQRDQQKAMSGIRAQGGKAGFAGSGGTQRGLSDAQRAYQLEQKKMTGQLSNRRDQLMGGIQSERQQYDEELWSAYSTWLSSDPEELSEGEVQESSACLAGGGYIGPNGNCINPGDAGYVESDWGTGYDDTDAYATQFEQWMQS
jgi:hypothetical protein